MPRKIMGGAVEMVVIAGVENGVVTPIVASGAGAQSVSVSLPSAIVSGQETVDAAGTAQVIGASATLVSGVTVKALAGNSGIVYVGNSAVDSTNGFELSASEAVFIETDDVANVWVDAATNDDGISYVGS